MAKDRERSLTPADAIVNERNRLTSVVSIATALTNGGSFYSLMAFRAKAADIYKAAGLVQGLATVRAHKTKSLAHSLVISEDSKESVYLHRHNEKQRSDSSP